MLAASCVSSCALPAGFQDKIRERFGNVLHSAGEGGFAPCKEAWDTASAASHLSNLCDLLASVPFALQPALFVPKRLHQTGWLGMRQQALPWQIFEL